MNRPSLGSRFFMPMAKAWSWFSLLLTYSRLSTQLFALFPSMWFTCWPFGGPRKASVTSL